MSATPKDLPPWDCPDQVYPRAARIVREYLEKLDRVNPDGSSGEDIERDLMEPISQLEQELERVNALLARIKERERTNTRYADEDWMREVTPVAHLISTIEALSVCLHDEESAGWKMKMRTDLCWQEVTLALQTLRTAAPIAAGRVTRSESDEAPTPVPAAPTMTDAEADACQDWKNLDGAVAWHLIERHADNWQQVGAMMEAWLRARCSALNAVQATKEKP